MLTSNNIELFLLNAILTQKDNYFLIFEKIGENGFKNDINKRIYEYLCKKFNNEDDFDIEIFGIKNDLEEYILEIQSMENEFEVQYLISFFIEKNKNSILDKTVKDISKSYLSLEEKEFYLKQALEEISNQSDISEISDASASINRYKDYIDNVKKMNETNQNGLLGISTGINALNDKIKGLKNQDFILVGARPSQGKTALVIRFLLEAIYSNANPVMFSLEMQKEQIVGRLLAQINTALGMNNTMYAEDFENKEKDINELLEFLETKSFFIEDFIDANGAGKPKITINDLRIKVKEIRKELKKEDKKIGLVIVDYLQLLSAETIRNGMSTNDIMSDISKGLKSLGRLLQCPIVVLSQLNRDLEKRQDKRPQMSDLRDSGALEQDADIIMFVYRSAVYLEKEIREQLKKKPGDAQLLRELSILEHQEVTDAEIIIGKQRNGPIGIVNAEFYKKCSMFGDVNEFVDDVFSNEGNDMYE